MRDVPPVKFVSFPVGGDTLSHGSVVTSSSTGVIQKTFGISLSEDDLKPVFLNFQYNYDHYKRKQEDIYNWCF